jgi:hypothetical protein
MIIGKVDPATATLIMSGLLIFMTCFSMPAQAQQTADTRQAPPLNSSEIAVGDLYAVIVGISRYSHPKIPKLTVSDKDARDFADFLLTQKKLFRNVHLTLLCNEEATRTELEKNLYYKLRRSGKDDTVIVFLSGHGADDPNTPGEFFFLTYDADPEFLAATSVHMNRQWFVTKLDSKRVVLIADACHAGGFSTTGTKSGASSLAKFLSQFKESEGKVFITSSRADEVSNEKAELGNSLFTYFLIKGLRGEADTDGDGVVTIKEVYDYVYEKTKEATSGVQHPQMEGRLLGAFPLSLNVNIQISVTPEVGTRPAFQQPKVNRLKVGEYFVEGTNPNGTSYRGKAVISQAGDKYELVWEIAGKKHFGRGMISGKSLYVNWGTNPEQLDGLVTYSMGENSVLKGVWADGKGTETLIPKR